MTSSTDTSAGFAARFAARHPRRNLKSIYGLACTVCGQPHELVVHLSGSFSLTADGLVPLDLGTEEQTPWFECTVCSGAGPLCRFIAPSDDDAATAD